MQEEEPHHGRRATMRAPGVKGGKASMEEESSRGETRGEERRGEERSGNVSLIIRREEDIARFRKDPLQDYSEQRTHLTHAGTVVLIRTP